MRKKLQEAKERERLAKLEANGGAVDEDTSAAAEEFDLGAMLGKVDTGTLRSFSLGLDDEDVDVDVDGNNDAPTHDGEHQNVGDFGDIEVVSLEPVASISTQTEAEEEEQVGEESSEGWEAADMLNGLPPEEEEEDVGRQDVAPTITMMSTGQAVPLEQAGLGSISAHSPEVSSEGWEAADMINGMPPEDSSGSAPQLDPDVAVISLEPIPYYNDSDVSRRGTIESTMDDGEESGQPDDDSPLYGGAQMDPQGMRDEIEAALNAAVEVDADGSNAITGFNARAKGPEMEGFFDEIEAAMGADSSSSSSSSSGNVSGESQTEEGEGEEQQEEEEEEEENEDEQEEEEAEDEDEDGSAEGGLSSEDWHPPKPMGIAPPQQSNLEEVEFVCLEPMAVENTRDSLVPLELESMRWTSFQRELKEKRESESSDPFHWSSKSGDFEGFFKSPRGTPEKNDADADDAVVVASALPKVFKGDKAPHRRQKNLMKDTLTPKEGLTMNMELGMLEPLDMTMADDQDMQELHAALSPRNLVARVSQRLTALQLEEDQGGEDGELKPAINVWMKGWLQCISAKKKRKGKRLWYAAIGVVGGRASWLYWFPKERQEVDPYNLSIARTLERSAKDKLCLSKCNVRLGGTRKRRGKKLHKMDHLQFTIVRPDGASLILQAESEEERDLWCKILKSKTGIMTAKLHHDGEKQGWVSIAGNVRFARLGNGAFSYYYDSNSTTALSACSLMGAAVATGTGQKLGGFAVGLATTEKQFVLVVEDRQAAVEWEVAIRAAIAVAEDSTRAQERPSSLGSTRGRMLLARSSRKSSPTGSIQLSPKRAARARSNSVAVIGVPKRRTSRFGSDRGSWHGKSASGSPRLRTSKSDQKDTGTL